MVRSFHRHARSLRPQDILGRSVSRLLRPLHCSSRLARIELFQVRFRFSSALSVQGFVLTRLAASSARFHCPRRVLTLAMRPLRRPGRPTRFELYLVRFLHTFALRVLRHVLTPSAASSAAL